MNIINLLLCGCTASFSQNPIAYTSRVMTSRYMFNVTSLPLWWWCFTVNPHVRRLRWLDGLWNKPTRLFLKQIRCTRKLVKNTRSHSKYIFGSGNWCICKIYFTLSHCGEDNFEIQNSQNKLMMAWIVNCLEALCGFQMIKCTSFFLT